MKLRHRMTLAVAAMAVVAAGGGAFAATADPADAGAAPDTGEKRASDGTPTRPTMTRVMSGPAIAPAVPPAAMTP